MKNSSTNVPYVECPYCDGENAVARIKSDGTAHNLSQCEIACTHCQSLFLLSESKNGVRTRSAFEFRSTPRVQSMSCTIDEVGEHTHSRSRPFGRDALRCQRPCDG